jgi:hypothetical protein
LAFFEETSTMSRAALGLSFLVILSGVSGGAAQAQFYVGYPGSVSFAGSTVQGDILRGWGEAGIGMGLYNLNSAAAGSIEADTWMRLNQYLYEASREQSRRLTALEAQRRYRRESARKATCTRIADHPEPRDIYRGDTLNALAGIVAGMNVHPSASRAARVGVPGGTLQRIPLLHASSQSVISAARLDFEGQWPLLLYRPGFDAPRRRCEANLESVESELLERRLSSGTLDALDRSVDALLVEFRSIEASANPLEARQARAVLDQLSRTTRTLRDPLVQNVLSDVLGYLGTSVSDMLSFLQRHNLRFAAAAGPGENELFEDLHGLLTEYRQKLVETVANR